MPDAVAHSVVPSDGERGLSSWEPADLAGLVLPAWDAFCALANDVDLDEPSRVPGWNARDVCVHLGSWPGSRSMQRLRDEASAGDASHVGHSSHGRGDGWFDQDAHNEALVAAHGSASRDEVLAALGASRDEAATYFSSPEAEDLGTTMVRSALGPLPLSAVVGATSYELAVHALDLEPAGARPPPPDLLTAGLAALVDVTGALAARYDITVTAGGLAPEGGWAFATSGPDWLTMDLPAIPTGWAVVDGPAAALLDASAGRRGVPALLARRELRLHHAAGLLALAPIVDAVPGLPGGSALGGAARHLRGAGQLLRRIPGF